MRERGKSEEGRVRARKGGSVGEVEGIIGGRDEFKESKLKEKKEQQ